MPLTPHSDRPIGSEKREQVVHESESQHQCAGAVYVGHSLERDRERENHAGEERADAHSWWGYIWHEMKRQNRQAMHQAMTRAEGEGMVATVDSSGQVSILRSNLELQAIEIATIKQVIFITINVCVFSQCLFLRSF